MKKSPARLISLLLVLIFVVTLLPTGALAAAADPYVAEIGEDKYQTLAEAMTAAETDDEITMLRSVELTERIVIEGKSISLDLHGKKISFTNDNADMQAFKVTNGALTVDDESTDHNGSIESSTNYAIFVSKAGGLTVKNGTIKCSASSTNGAAISGNGNGSHGGTTIAINGGTIEGSALAGGAGIYHPQSGTLTITGGTIKGGTALEVKSGSVAVAISGEPEFIATYDGAAGSVANSNGTSSHGYSVAVVENASYVGNASVRIASGKYNGAIGKVVDSENSSEYSISITGGSFTDLKSAVEYAADTATITLLDNTAADVVVPAGKTITLNLNGKTLTNVSGNTIVNKGTLTVTGSGAVKNVSVGKAALLNDVGGTVTLDGGTFTKETNVNYYVIENHGVKVTINSGVTVTGPSTNSSAIENGWASASANKGGTTSAMVINGGAIASGGLYTVKNDDYGVMTINGGEFTNTVAGHGTVLNWNELTIEGGEFFATNANVVTCSDTAESGDPKYDYEKGVTTINGGEFEGYGPLGFYADGSGNFVAQYANAVNITITGGKFKGIMPVFPEGVTPTVSITGGDFTSNPADYVTDAEKTVKPSELSGYAYTIGEKEENVEIVAPVVEAKAARGVEVTDEVAAAIAAAANTSVKPESAADLSVLAAGDVIKEDGKIDIGTGAAKTVAEIKESKESEFNALPTPSGSPSPEVIAAVVVVQPYMDIKVVEATIPVGDDAPATLTLDIEPMSQVLITRNWLLNGTLLTEGNAIPVGEPQKLTVTEETPVTLTVGIPAVLAKSDGSEGFLPLSIRHIKDSGAVHYYEAAVSKVDDAFFATFTVTHGFSKFTLAEQNTRTLKVNYDLDGATDATYSITDVGVALPVVSGYSGWAFEGASGVYTTLTETLWNTLTGEKENGTEVEVAATAQPIVYSPTPKAGMQNFVKDASRYTPGMYTDVPADQWFGDDKEACVKDATLLGIVEGYGDGKFGPDDTLKVSEAIKAACVIYSTYEADGQAFRQGEPWYQVYVDYAIAKGIIKAGDFTDYTAVCTRAQAAYIFARALPEKELAKISELTPPDVAATDSYGAEIYLLYAAGVIRGNDDKGTFEGGGAFTRAQAAAIITRLCLPASRAK